VRGTGHVRDGSVDTLFNFMHTSGFNRDDNRSSDR
jgi:hypothetical protein